MSATLYRHYDKSGRLLYVGYSITVFARLMAHIYGSCWAEEIATIKLDHFADKLKGWHAEQLAIANEKPKYNKNFTPLRGTEGAASIEKRIAKRKVKDSTKGKA